MILMGLYKVGFGCKRQWILLWYGWRECHADQPDDKIEKKAKQTKRMDEDEEEL